MNIASPIATMNKLRDQPMTSARRSKIIIMATVIGAICFYGQRVKVWTPEDVFGVIGAGATALIAGMTKSPREGGQSDAAEGETVSALSTTTLQTNTTIEKEAPIETIPNPDSAVPVRAAAG